MLPEEDVDRSGEFASAAVVAGGTLMPYRCVGRGPAVLLVSGSADSRAGLGRWRRALAARFRVLEPTPAGDGDDPLAMALQRFLDGLGLQSVRLVADAATAGEMLSLALCEPERISRLLIILPPAAGGPSAWPATAPFTAGDLQVRVVRAPARPEDAGPAAELPPELAAFLAGDA